MTVEQLVERLYELPQDAEVVVDIEFEKYVPISAEITNGPAEEYNMASIYERGHPIVSLKLID